MKIMLVMKDFRDRNGNFTDSAAEEVRSFGHEVILATSVNAAQRAVNDGYRPEMLYMDNSLENANFFVKQMRGRFKDSKIYMVVSQEPSDADTPERLSLNGFIVGALKVSDIIEIAGDLRPPEPEPEPVLEEDPFENDSVVAPLVPIKATPADKGAANYDPPSQGRSGDSEKRGLVITIPWPRRRKRPPKEAPPAPAHDKDGAKESRKQGKDDHEKSPDSGGKNYLLKNRLAFPAVLGVFVIAAGMMYMGAKPNNPSPARVLPSYYGMTLDQANDALVKTGKQYEVIEARSADGTDLIISQEPPAGTPLSDVDKVQVMFSKKADTAVSASEEIATGQDALPDGGGSGEPAPSAPTSYVPSQASKAPAAAPKAASSRPQVSVSASPTSGPSSGFIVTLRASASDPDGGSIVSYSWSCGGSGPRASCEMVSNVAPVTRVITCTVTDDEGQTASASVTIYLK